MLVMVAVAVSIVVYAAVTHKIKGIWFIAWHKECSLSCLTRGLQCSLCCAVSCFHMVFFWNLYVPEANSSVFLFLKMNTCGFTPAPLPRGYVMIQVLICAGKLLTIQSYVTIMAVEVTFCCHKCSNAAAIDAPLPHDSKLPMELVGSSVYQLLQSPALPNQVSWWACCQWRGSTEGSLGEG